MMELEFEHDLFLEFVELFNAGRYYESHEAMEKLWIKHGRRKGDAYQGYVQLAAALEQSRRGRSRGAGRLLAKARTKLEHVDGDPWNTLTVLRDTERFLGQKGPVPTIKRRP